MVENMPGIGLVWVAAAVDAVFGDPRRLPHPVVLFGHLIAGGESFLRRFAVSPTGLKISGAMLALFITGAVYFGFWALLLVLHTWSYYAYAGLQVFLIFQCLAWRELVDHGRAILSPLLLDDLSGARMEVGKIVGRDTDELEHQGIVRAAVESIAESTVDGILAPLFYAVIGGAPLALAYKAISTMDSMIGYRNEKYADFGWAAARLDDLVNYLPARLAIVCFTLVAPVTPGGIMGVLRTIWRDSRKHPSPNSGIPEAAMAGALQVELGGLNYYEGVPSRRARMGLPTRSLESEDIKRALYIMTGVSVTFVGLVSLTVSIWPEFWGEIGLWASLPVFLQE